MMIFIEFKSEREKWKFEDSYSFPPPIQYFEEEGTFQPPMTMVSTSSNRLCKQ